MEFTASVMSDSIEVGDDTSGSVAGIQSRSGTCFFETKRAAIAAARAASRLILSPVAVFDETEICVWVGS